MINGAATPAGTADYARRHEGSAFELLGKTQWTVSAAGFGCYRVSAGTTAHFEAMSAALDGGVNVIDTSTNYADGESERLVGQVMAKMIAEGRVYREHIVVVSKAGYLQGRNYALSQQRKEQGKPFEDLVPYAEGLEHCIHPEFLADQLQRSLQRLNLETLDVFLLHNPEYYLDWCAKQAVATEQARAEFYARIARAFEYLEKEVSRGRIQCYGVSSNAFPSAAADKGYVGLEQVWRIADSVSAQHHFRVIQLPMNLFEPGAALEPNQSDGRSVLQFAETKELGVMINRPLNAFNAHRLIRLAEVSSTRRFRDDDIIIAINALNASEKTLWRKLLPAMQLPQPLYRRVKDQAAIGDHLKHYWRNFGSYDRWRQFKDGMALPRLQGVFDFMRQHAAHLEGVVEWLDDHERKLDGALRSVESLYVGEVARQVANIRQAVTAADSDWAVETSLSQLALRSLRTTQGISTVLVGMRQPGYVSDILEELKRSGPKADRVEAWQRLRQSLSFEDN